MNEGYRAWRHVFKLDPDRDIGDAALERICHSGTDAILIGGTTGVTEENTIDLLSRVRRYPVDCALEVSDAGAVVPGFDWYLVPVVLNAASAEWVTRKHQRAIRQYAPLIPWDLLVPEGYVILNADSAAARLTEADTALDAGDVCTFADLAERMFRLPVVYIEYSGTFGDMDLVRAANARLREARLFYGGVDGPEKARRAAEAADTVVVGNALYTDLEAALAAVEAVRSVAIPGRM